MSYPTPEYQPQPASQQPAPTGGSNWAGIIALVVGIVAIVMSFIPIVNVVAIILGVVAVVFGIIGLVRKSRSKGMSITGLILGGIAIIIAVIVLIITSVFVSTVSDAVDDANESMNAEHEVVYSVTVNKGSADVDYGSSASTSSDTVKGAWTKTGTMTGYDVATVTVSGDYEVSGQKLTCEIKLDGETVDQQTGTDIASCTATTN